MKTRAFKLILQGADFGLLEQDMDTSSPQRFENALGLEMPALFIMANKDLEKIKAFKDLVVDRGRKHQSVELSRLLLKDDQHSGKALLLRTDYTVPARLKGALKSFFRKAEKARKKNYYVIGVSDELIEDFSQKVSSPQPEPITELEADHDEFSSFVSPPPEPIASQLAKEFVGNSSHARRVRTLVYRATLEGEGAKSILILGETGTGKEVVARSIHKYDQRVNKGDFVPVNCSAMPELMLESELFGYKRGAFTGATTDRKGLWESAERGTLFLDEIGDLTTSTQPKILRALEAKKIRPLGANRETDVTNVRVIAATNRDLHAMVESGRFREDLYYRLGEFFVRTPSLRDHPEDIPDLANHFWNQHSKGRAAKLAPETLAALRSYTWPGNARQLRLVLSHLQSLFPTVAEIQVKHLKFVLNYLGAAYLEGALKSSQEVSLKSIESLRNIRRVEEVLRMCRAKLQPLVEQRTDDKKLARSVQGWIAFRLRELEELCSQPSLFSKGPIFLAVHQLLGKMIYFNDLLESEPAGAVKFWRREIAKEFQGACSQLQTEGQRLLNQA